MINFNEKEIMSLKSAYFRYYHIINSASIILNTSNFFCTFTNSYLLNQTFI